MRLDLLPRQCVSCPAQLPACTCSAQQSCILISQSCNACPTFTCQPIQSVTAGGGGSSVSAGALAGAIVGVLSALGGALLVFFLYRRRQRARGAAATSEVKPDVPAPAEAVLNRPDPTEKPSPQPETARPPSPPVSVIDVSRHASLPSNNTPLCGGQPGGNPFDDTQSIQTTSTHTNGTNVIPIALASSLSAVSAPSRSESAILPPSSPVRPARPSDLSLDGSHVSTESLHEPSPNYARSQRSGSSRMSCMSGASYSSDLLNEAPMIVTHGQGAVRQVLGKAKAEVIQTSGPSTPTSLLSLDSLKPPSVPSRPSIRSPLASTSFGPGDVVEEGEEDYDPNRSDPFDDHHTSSNQPRPESELLPEAPIRPWVKQEQPSRPESISSQDGTVADISSATRVNVGLAGRLDQKSPYRTTVGKLVTPSSVLSGGETPSLEQQQQLALAHAQAQARAHGLEKAKRVSGTSVVSTTSTRADSILESFPFVPPSPIASRPVRSPPRSPLYQGTVNNTSFPTQIPTPPPSATGSVSPNPPQHQSDTLAARSDSALPPLTPPPSRRMLGMSTASQLSTASSGLGNFPFQIDHGGMEGNLPPPTLQDRQRASLDTLALMSDLSSYPLCYDRDGHESMPPLPKP